MTEIGTNASQTKGEPVIAPAIAVVIPCFRVRKQILGVLARIGAEVSKIYVVDDRCPEDSGDLVEERCTDPRVRVIRNPENQGVGGAVMAGYQAAIADGAAVIVKVDGDGQMDPALIPYFVAPILAGRADYTKGNRFYDLTNINRMPKARLFGNAVLSFMSKLSTGYWHIFDPTNGYTAIDARVASYLHLHRISRRYFFETDILFHLNTLRAVVTDVPMDAVYSDENSSLVISRVIGEFLLKHLRNFGMRLFLNYFLRDMTVATIELFAGLLLFGFGVVYGSIHWLHALATKMPTPLGIIMLAALPTIAGLQMLLAFLSFDVANVPSRPIGACMPPRVGRSTPRNGGLERSK